MTSKNRFVVFRIVHVTMLFVMSVIWSSVVHSAIHDPAADTLLAAMLMAAGILIARKLIISGWDMYSSLHKAVYGKPSITEHDALKGGYFLNSYLWFIVPGVVFWFLHY